MRSLENEVGPGVVQWSVRKHASSKNAKGIKHRRLSRFCPYYLETLQGACLLNTALKRSRSNLVFEIHNDFIFGMIYCLFLWDQTFCYLKIDRTVCGKP